MGVNTCLECFRSFIRIILGIVNIIVILLGLLVFIVGVWSKVEGNQYVDLTSGGTQAYAQVPWLLIWMGIFVIIFGIVGVVGAVFAFHVAGRIILGLYGFVLALLVIIEIAGGIAAGVEKNQLSSSIQKGVNDSFAQYNSTDHSVRDTWDQFQKSFKCCGTTGYEAYQRIIGFNPPTSCCTNRDTCDTSKPENLWSQGCTSKVQNNIGAILGAVAGVAITFGLFQIVGIVLSCFVAIAGRTESNTYQVV